MSETSLNALERDVEAARLRFADSLSVLASPDSYAEAAAAAKRDARRLTRRAEHSLQRTADGYLDEIKARAAANPAAVLAVAAGVAWRLFQKPPIATALVGAGLYSLLRTTPEDFGDEDRIDYTGRAKERLREQMTDARDTVLEKAAEVGTSLREKAGEVGASIREKAGELASEAATSATNLAQSAQENIRQFSSEAGERAAALASDAGKAAREGAVRSADTARETVARSAHAISDNRDQALLGIAGVAVAAAIGVALHRRMEE